MPRKAKPLPKIAPCPHPGCRRAKVISSSNTADVEGAIAEPSFWVQCLCGWQGPHRATEIGAIAAWGDRAPAAAESLIVSKRGVMGGAPCVRGTRITVQVLQSMGKEFKISDILRMYPGLTAEGLADALTFGLR